MICHEELEKYYTCIIYNFFTPSFFYVFKLSAFASYNYTFIKCFTWVDATFLHDLRSNWKRTILVCKTQGFFFSNLTYRSDWNTICTEHVYYITTNQLALYKVLNQYLFSSCFFMQLFIHGATMAILCNDALLQSTEEVSTLKSIFLDW